MHEEVEAQAGGDEVSGGLIAHLESRGHKSQIKSSKVLSAKAPPGTRVQFERTGYFCVDKESTPGQLTMNRIVTLRDTWQK